MKTFVPTALVLIGALGFAPTLDAQPIPFRINEVIFGDGSSDDIVELVNTSSLFADTAGLNLCSDFQYRSLGSASVPPQGTIRVHVGVAGNDTATDLFTGVNFPGIVGTAGNMSLYRPGGGFGFFDSAANMLDFVQWGQGNQPRAGLAVQNGFWPASSAFLASVSAGQSLAWDGDGEALSDWFRDASPTSGAPNLNADAATNDLGPGCDVGTPDRLELVGAPALGNLDLALSVETDNPSAPAVLFAGIGSIDASVAVVCHFYVSSAIAGVQVGFTTNGAGNRTIPIFVEDPSVVGLEISLQAAVANAVAFPKFDLTNGRSVTF